MDVNSRLFPGEEEKAVTPLSKDGGAQGLSDVGEVMTEFFVRPPARGTDETNRGVGLGGPSRTERGSAISKGAQRLS